MATRPNVYRNKKKYTRKEKHKDENICDGVHIMAIGAEDKVPTIMERAGLL